MSIPDPYQDPFGKQSAPGAGSTPPYDPAVGTDPVAGAPYSSAATGGVPPAGGVPPGFNGPYPGAAGYVPGAPNPALAGLLGFIPGVGAMYNGQFAKGIAHIVIFAVFESLASHTAGVFGLLVAGWEFYMAFEAYHTARARRDGLPLPDPFGLNNIGERFGFKGNPDFSSFWHPSATPPPPPPAQPSYQSGYQVDPAGNVYAAPPVDAAYPPPPEAAYAQPPYGASYVPPAGQGFPPPPAGYPPYAAGGFGQPGYGQPGYGVPVPPVPPVAVQPRGGLPVGALWLIGLGVFALLGSLHPFAFLEGEATGGLFLMGLSAFLFYRKYSLLRGVYPAGSAGARWNLVRAGRGAGAVFMVGLLTLLQGLHVIRWESSWPLLLIVLGLLALAERVALNGMNAETYPPAAPGGFPGQPYANAPEPPAPAASNDGPVSIVPKSVRPSNDLNEREGR